MGFFRKSPKAGAANAPADEPAAKSTPEPANVADEGRQSNDDSEDNAENLAQVNTTATEDLVYPSGLKLGLLLTSIFISMFLVALVRVLCPMPLPTSPRGLGALGVREETDALTSRMQDRLIIATAIPQITDDFHSVEDIGWYGSAYLLATCAFQLLFGKLYTFYSVKVIFLTTVFLFEVGSAVCGAAPTSVAFIIGRAISGIGAAGIFSGVVSRDPYSDSFRTE